MIWKHCCFNLLFFSSDLFLTLFLKENWVTCTMCGKSSRYSPDISVSEALVAPSSAAISSREQKHSPCLRLPPGHALFGPLGVGSQVVDQLPADLVGGLERFVLLHTQTQLEMNVVYKGIKENAGFVLFFFWGGHKKIVNCVFMTEGIKRKWS